MKKSGEKKRKVFLCPVCGNDIPYTHVFSKYSDIKCGCCRQVFPKTSVVTEIRKGDE